MTEKKCKQCGSKFIPRKNKFVYCSTSCSAAARTKIDWPDDLPELVAKSSKLAIAKQLGVSDKAVAKRLKKHF